MSGPPGAEELARVLHERFREILLRHVEDGVAPIPGALETMTRLRDEAVRVALTTGFDRPMTDAVPCWKAPDVLRCHT